MASVVNESVLSQVQAFHSYWTEHFDAGDAAPVAGIYRCLGCSREAVMNAGEALPQIDDHNHEHDSRARGWLLNVRAQTC